MKVQLGDNGIEVTGAPDTDRWFRAGVSRGEDVKVDREAGIIHGFSVLSIGPALGHGMDVDAKTLQQVIALGSISKFGIKSRFDHPNASSTSMGSHLGRAVNFRLSEDKTKALADLHLNESAKKAPGGDYYTYTMDLAESDPQAFGASIVFSGKSEHVLNDDGTRKNGKDGKPMPDLARVEKLFAVDVVDEPAANAGGLFSADGEESLAAKLTGFLNRWAENNLMPSLQASILATFKEGTTMSEEMKAEGIKLGVIQERTRVSEIMRRFTQVWGDKHQAIELKVRDGAVDADLTADEAEKMFKTRKLTMLTSEAPETAGGVEANATHADLSHLPADERYAAEFTRTPGLRDEFGSLSTYVAFKRAEDAGFVRMKNTPK